MRFRMMVSIGIAAASIAVAGANAQRGRQSAIRIPDSMRAEHAEVHEQLEAATKVSGPVGAAAHGLARLLGPHFEREEQIALPPLGLLEPLAKGQYTADMRQVLPLTDTLKREWASMVQEHVAIRAATEQLQRVAREHHNEAVAELATKLMQHARSEEEIHYPAAVLVGELVRLHGQHRQ